MEKSLIAALRSMLTIQRWNLHPRVETWVEAENAALRAHLAYAIYRESQLPNDNNGNETCGPKMQIIHLLLRTLLKPLNKHFMTDISVFVTKELKERKKDWELVVNGCAADTAKLFPREISKVMNSYLSYKGDYAGGWDKERWGKGMAARLGSAKDQIDKVIKFCKYRVQEQECKVNYSIYESEYKCFFENEIEKEIAKPEYNTYRAIIGDGKYFNKIVNLKYLRRWNTANRFVPSSVLGHTYVVTILASVFSLMEIGKGEVVDFVYEALLRSLFHDVPEAVTGDIITPVKDRIRKAIPKTDETGKDVIAEIEEKLTADEIIGVAPTAVGEEIGKGGLDLFKDLTNKDVNKCISLVKDCDRLSLMLECLYEKEAGVIAPEMKESYHKHRRELSNSEWPSVRRFLDILSDQWRLSN